jgi:hypothetical protein
LSGDWGSERADLNIQPARMQVEAVDATAPLTVCAADAERAGRDLRGRLRAPAAFVVLFGVAVFVAGCGGGSGLTVANMPGVSATGHHPASSRFGRGGGPGFVGVAPNPAQQAAAMVTQLRFSRCMRAHGVPNFPDPSSASGGVYGNVFGPGGIDPSAPLFRVAQRLCQAVFTQRAVVVP